jgi:glycosyltransferase involved in cell wall biosynthesis
VDPSVFDPSRFLESTRLALRRRLGISEDATVVMFIGTFGQWHGVGVFANAIRTLVDRDSEWLRSKKVHFLLVGDGLMMPEVRETLSGAPYEAFATLAGLVPQSEAPQHLAIADVVASPHVGNADGSRFFGSPTKLFEYMAMGKAIVASNLDQIGTVLKEGIHAGELPCDGPQTGERGLAVLCPPGDVEALCRGLRFAVASPAWRDVLGRNARAEALAKYTWSHHVSAILESLPAKGVSA